MCRWLISVYYILVTVGTVGYGEPHGVWGKTPRWGAIVSD